VTIHDVARHAGVSSMTVSRVINKNVKVSDELTEKVLASVKALRYQLNTAASSTRSGQGRIRIGVLYSNPSAAFLNEILVGGFDQAARLGCQLMLEKCSGLHSQKTAVRRLLDEGVDGLILPPPLCDDRPRVQSLLREGLPLLALGGGEPLSEVLSVRIDDFQGALTMTRYLIRLGHRRIGFIRGDEEHAPSQKRYEGFLQGMREAGLEIDEALIVRGRFTYQSGLAAAETLLQTPRRPTAIFASNDDMAAAVLAVAHGMRIYVPDELSVCGFDDTPVASTVWPQITTIHQPIAAMGRAAVTAMTEAIKAARAGRDHGPAHMTMKFSLIERGSAGPAPQLQIFRSQTEGGVLPR
jgi:LacI family transcriptional regulator